MKTSNSKYLCTLAAALLFSLLAAFTSLAAGPGDAIAAAQSKGDGVKRGTSLGMFTTTGYCNCSICSSGHNLTYSGTVPRAGHTVSADINVFPLGTKLMIDDTIYTVEDIGGGVSGNKLDIYYDNHEAALNHGRKTQEIFTVES